MKVAHSDSTDMPDLLDIPKLRWWQFSLPELAIFIAIV